MAGWVGFKVSLIKAFQPHLLVFYGVVDYLSLDLGFSIITQNNKPKGGIL
jgi:hypothetical protein